MERLDKISFTFIFLFLFQFLQGLKIFQTKGEQILCGRKQKVSKHEIGLNEASIQTVWDRIYLHQSTFDCLASYFCSLVDQNVDLVTSFWSSIKTLTKTQGTYWFIENMFCSPVVRYPDLHPRESGSTPGVTEIFVKCQSLKCEQRG